MINGLCVSCKQNGELSVVREGTTAEGDEEDEQKNIAQVS